MSLGGGFKYLTQYQLNKLLDHAYALGINKIDTAPLYESEQLIGNYLRINPNFLISTKTIYTRKHKSQLEVLKNLQISLEKLQIQSVDCLFYHSTPPQTICKANIIEFDNLKKSGLIRKIGYSGDNFKLDDLNIESYLDCLMVTSNALDISDQHLIHQSKKEIYIKRPMANFIFKPDWSKKVKFSIRNLLKEHSIDPQSYQFRFEKMNGRNKSSTENFQFFVKFITSFYPSANYVFGVNSIKHLDEIVDAIKFLGNELSEDLLAYLNRLRDLTEQYNWRSLP